MGQVSRTIINGLLQKQGGGKKRRRRKLNIGQYERDMQEYLHAISYRYLGQPPPGNRWLYPDIFLWDENENGDHVIPALVAFYFNVSVRIPWETRHKFSFHLRDQIPPAWDLHWHMGEGYVWAERRIEGIVSTIPAREQEYLAWTEKVYDETLERTNGHKDIGDGDNLLVVPYDESDPGEILPHPFAK